MKEGVCLPNYIYTAIDQAGKRLKQKVAAPNEDAVKSMLRMKNLYIISIEEESIFNKEITFGSDNIFPAKQIALFARQFSMLLKAGISVSESLDILREQLDNKQMVKVVDDIYQEVLKGAVLSTAMRNTNKLPDLFVNTIEAGESGGFLDEVMERMATYYEKTTKLVSKVKSAMIYPSMVLLVTIVVSYILVTQVVPTFAEMFASMDLELPFLTRMLMSIGNFFNTYWMIIFGVLVAIIGLLIYYLKTPSGRFQKDLILLNIPLIKEIILKSIVSRFSRTLSILLKTGVPMINAIEYATSVLNNTVMEKTMQVVKNDVTSGSNLSTPIQQLGVFPRMVVSMIKIGEETGALDEMMNRCADFYDEEVETLSGRITSLIEPLIILLLAGIVGTIVMAIIQPMFQMYSAIAV